jgi:flagellar hook-associated protein 2
MASPTSSLTIPTFTGSSTYSSSFQQVLTTAVERADLPIQELQVNVNNLTNQESALNSLESSFQSLSSALQAIGTAATGSVSASVSDPTVVSAAATSSALSGTYSIQVDSPGSYSTAMSQKGSPVITDPTTQGLSSASSFTLTANGTTTTITPENGSLEALASAINSSSAGAQATIINYGSSASPDYRLVVTSTSLNGDDLQLAASTAGSPDLLGTVSPGSPATYQVNGSTTILQSNSPQVTLSPGLTVTLLKASPASGGVTTPDTITVSTNYSTLQTALSNFATAYNSTFSAVEQQTGNNQGALAGQSIVYTMQNILESLPEYSSGTGSVSSLNELGLQVDDKGVMTFDASVFSGQNTAAIQQFLGSATSSGFMQAATNALSSVDDSTSGDIQTENTELQSQIDAQNTQITNKQAQLSLMETNLEQELTQADAAIADLQEQKTFYTELFQAQYPSGTAA